MNFDPDQPDLHFACQVFYSPLGKIRLVDADGTVHAAQSYANDQNDPSRAAVTALPALPEGYEIVPGQTIRGFDAAARTVDPNNPADARAVGANIDIVIREVANNPTPEPSSTPSTPAPAPSTPSTPAPSTPATPAPTPSVSATPAPSTPATPAKQTPAPRLACTGSVAGGSAGAPALLGLIGAGVIALRRCRA